MTVLAYVIINWVRVQKIMGDIIEIYWMESTIHPLPLICDPKTMFVPNITVWESLIFFGLSEVLFRDESSPYSSTLTF